MPYSGKSNGFLIFVKHKNEHVNETEFYYMAEFRVSPDTKVFQRFLNLGGVF